MKPLSFIQLRNDSSASVTCREAVDWLSKQFGEYGFESVTVFSAPKFLDAWRKVQSNGLSDKVDLHEADLASFDGAALARHPAILDLLNMNAATTR